MVRRYRAIRRSAAVHLARDPGSRALLFERLTDGQFHSQKENKPFRSHDIEGLELSLHTELERLLNTRSGPLALNGVMKETVINYGVPDKALDNPNGVRNQEKLCKDLKGAIRNFEPRLSSVDVSIADSDSRVQSVTVEISGEVELDSEKLAVRFPVLIRGEENSNE